MDFMFVEKLRYGFLEGTLFFVHGGLQSKAFLSAVFLHELIEINELLTFFDLKYTVFNYKLPFLSANQILARFKSQNREISDKIFFYQGVFCLVRKIDTFYTLQEGLVGTIFSKDSTDLFINRITLR